MDVCGCMYVNRVNDDVFETFLKSFRSVSDALLQVYIGELDIDAQVSYWANQYDVCFKPMPLADYAKQRCYRRILCIHDILEHPKDTRIIFCDADLYFLADPFNDFPAEKQRIGITSRCHSYKAPINSGFIAFYAIDNSDYVFGELFNKYAQDNKAEWDWFIDQNYLNWLYVNSPTRVYDIGYQYNFCPNTDIFGVALASDMIRRAYECRAVKVLHLKSELQLLIYDGFLEHAVTKNPNGKWDWQNDNTMGHSSF